MHNPTMTWKLNLIWTEESTARKYSDTDKEYSLGRMPAHNNKRFGASGGSIPACSQKFCTLSLANQ